MATDADVSQGAPRRARIVRVEGIAHSDVHGEPDRKTGHRDLVLLNRSPLARKIIAFNLLAILMLVAGVLFLNPFRDSLVLQRESALINEAALLTSTFESQLLQNPDARFGRGLDAKRTLGVALLNLNSEAFVFDRDQAIIATTRELPERRNVLSDGIRADKRETVVIDGLDRIWRAISGILSAPPNGPVADKPSNLVKALVARAIDGGTHIEMTILQDGSTVFAVASPIVHDGEILGVVGLTSGAGEIDALARSEREQVLQMFVIAILVSIGLSLALASTIANPLSDLAAAAELGRDRNARAVKPGRVRIPDLSGRPDEIGRLSAALRGMVAALYDRIDSNEQFAADVAHEIKNPLASLRSAVGSLRFVKKERQREKLLDIIDHDVRRLDRLVSDISNASRLDSELVREVEERFDLLSTLRNLCDYLDHEARGRGVDFFTDLPGDPIMFDGLESRLAQVFVNLITNAISFCGSGDVIRVWARCRGNRVLIVVEDTGPGIPESAVLKIFERFYSERPEGQFGNNSGLGLAISKQIVEAHGGVIWAENIRSAHADPSSKPLGARFVVGLPV